MKPLTPTGRDGLVLWLQVATKTLPFYKDYFDVPYPLPKIDLIAIADFAAGEPNSVGFFPARYKRLPQPDWEAMQHPG